MRTTIKALLCSVLAAACAPIGERGDGLDNADAGVDGAGNGVCDQYQTKTMDLTINGSAGFNNLPQSCWKLNGKLTLTGPAVTSLAKLGDLREVRDLVIDDTDLTKIDTKSIVEVTGDITVRYNDKLTDIANLAAKQTAKSILVEYNGELTNLGGLAKAEVVTGGTIIRNNAKLTTVDLGRATRLEGGLLVADNNLVTKLDAHSLQSVGDFTFRNNAALADLGSLSALRFVHGTFTLDNNDNLVSLANSITSGMGTIDINVIISNNAKLSELGGLARTQYIGGSVQATSNSALTFCEVREIDCCVNSGQVLASGNQTTTCNQTGYSWCNQELGYCPYM
ncbi:MAG TPA: hypothetical protein VFV99_29515 [Kofleriaceae bacterium]|nr:hypothetical protein [Kofleriaceae bacterium]